MNIDRAELEAELRRQGSLGEPRDERKALEIIAERRRVREWSADRRAKRAGAPLRGVR